VGNPPWKRILGRRVLIQGEGVVELTKWRGPLGSELLTVAVVGMGLFWVVVFTVDIYVVEHSPLYIPLAVFAVLVLNIAFHLLRDRPVWRCVYSVYRDPEALSKVERALEEASPGRTSRMLGHPRRERVVLDLERGRVVVDRFVDRAFVYVGPVEGANRTQVELLKMSVERALGTTT
jgi:hypothetical protein